MEVSIIKQVKLLECEQINMIPIREGVTIACLASFTRPEVRPLRILCCSCYGGASSDWTFVQTFVHGSALHLSVHLELQRCGIWCGRLSCAYFM